MQAGKRRSPSYVDRHEQMNTCEAVSNQSMSGSPQAAWSRSDTRQTLHYPRTKAWNVSVVVISTTEELAAVISVVIAHAEQRGPTRAADDDNRDVQDYADDVTTGRAGLARVLIAAHSEESHTEPPTVTLADAHLKAVPAAAPAARGLHAPTQTSLLWLDGRCGPTSWKLCLYAFYAVVPLRVSSGMDLRTIPGHRLYHRCCCASFSGELHVRRSHNLNVGRWHN